ncbi:hypothetical protein [Butyrivibrio sp. AE3009]|uniref:hypothetical protein n=1 Tax=Butyrivibrio sp. AE3009 TaxID=1280666 RepID=UPI0003B578A3|nr:hypothetical protein [Butyrivibrio sp. AE3009]
MAKRPNAANFTHGLAQLGGGSLKEGGSGMLGGIQTVFKVGVRIGNQYGLEGKDLSKSLDEVATLFLEKH